MAIFCSISEAVVARQKTEQSGVVIAKCGNPTERWKLGETNPRRPINSGARSDSIQVGGSFVLRNGRFFKFGLLESCAQLVDFWGCDLRWFAQTEKNLTSPIPTSAWHRLRIYRL